MTVRAVPTIELLPVSPDGRKVGHVQTDQPGERDEWELPPDQDELLYADSVGAGHDLQLSGDLGDRGLDDLRDGFWLGDHDHV
jgi:hypothetical protein